jgi:hypothetical protein
MEAFLIFPPFVRGASGDQSVFLANVQTFPTISYAKILEIVIAA